MGHHGFLGEFEHLVLLSILQLGVAAHGPEISAHLERRAGRRVSRGALYSALDRLEGKGFLQWEVEPPSPDRGGHPKRRFEVTAGGLEALRVARDALANLSTGLDHFIGSI